MATVRMNTRTLWEALHLDCWPSSAATLIDFGLDGWRKRGGVRCISGADFPTEVGQERYSALQALVKGGYVSIERLDSLLGDGPLLDSTVTRFLGDGRLRVPFETSWDELPDWRASLEAERIDSPSDWERTSMLYR